MKNTQHKKLGGKSEYGSRVHLGLFDTAEKASEAYRKKAKGLHSEYYREA